MEARPEQIRRTAAVDGGGLVGAVHDRPLGHRLLRRQRGRRPDGRAAPGRRHRRSDHRRPPRSAGAQSRRAAPDPLSGSAAPPRARRSTTPSTTPSPSIKFRGTYRGVFPIKVNQLREVVEEILDAGRPFHYGLEVGSQAGDVRRPGRSTTTPSRSSSATATRTTTFIRMALLGRKLGKKVILIAEKLSEVRAITRDRQGDGRRAVDRHARPAALQGRRQVGDLGRRARQVRPLDRRDPRGDEILQARRRWSSAFKLLHFHIGSQIPDILIIKRAVREAALLLRQAPQAGPSDRVPRRRRRPRHRLRRLALRPSTPR